MEVGTLLLGNDKSSVIVNFVPVDNFNTNNKNDSPNKLIIVKKYRLIKMANLVKNFSYILFYIKKFFTRFVILISLS